MRAIFTIVALSLSLVACGDGKRAFEEPMVLGGVEVSPEVLNRGEFAYIRYCRGCHGQTGAGDGPYAVSLDPRPADLTRGEYPRLGATGGELPSDEALERVIMEGIEGTAMTPLGWLLAQLSRLIGAPPALDRHAAGQPAVVTVAAAGAGGAQTWTRVYGSSRGGPQLVCSHKRFTGPTGLEEVVGGGVGMALVLRVEDGVLTFRSSGFFLTLFGRRLPLPRWLSPGTLTIGHRDLGGGRFAFTLGLTHPIAGSLIRQTLEFSDMKEAAP